MWFPFSVTPRLVGIAVSGVVHATVFASLAFTTTGKGTPAAETILILETQPEVPAPRVVEPLSNEAKEPPPRVMPRTDQRPAAPPLERPADAPHSLAQFMMAIPSDDDVPAASDEGELGAASATDGAAVGESDETTYGEDEVSTPATLLSNINATYPMQAWASGLDADVPVEIIVDARGSVVSARVVTRAGHGFDESALASIESYRFTPAQRKGQAVRVRVRWSVQFRSRRPPAAAQ